MLVEPPISVRPLFVIAGWHPGRHVPVPASVCDHPAVAILASFAGLTVLPEQTSGQQCATSDLAFDWLDPEDIPPPAEWEVLLGSRLVGVAAVQPGHGSLFIAANGHCFGSSHVHDAFYFEGATFADAVEGLLLGRCARPMLRPDQASVMLYGITYTRSSPEVYPYHANTNFTV